MPKPKTKNQKPKILRKKKQKQLKKPKKQLKKKAIKVPKKKKTKVVKKKTAKKISKKKITKTKKKIQPRQTRKSKKTVIKRKKAVKKIQLKRKNKKRHLIPIGGMPFNNGLMLRGLNYAVIALRDETDKIEVFSFSTRNLREKFKLFFIPFFRGIFFILENIYFILKAANFKRALIQKILHRKPKQKRIYYKLSNFLLYLIYILLFVGFFDYLYIRLNAPAVQGSYLFFNNLIFTLLYTLFFVVVFFLVYFGRKGELELFAYHGLEHKVINAHEEFDAVNDKTLKKTHVVHQRCSISVFFWSIAFLSFFVTYFKVNEINWLVGFVLLVGLIFLSFSLAYELIKLANYSRILTAILIYPFYIIQSLTSYEPDSRHLYVGEVAYNEIIRLEREKD